MLLAYIDETGDRGYAGSQTFTLGCVIVPASRWQETFDGLIRFRRFLRQEFGLPVRAEVKANYLVRNKGPFRELGLPPGIRRRIWKMHLSRIPKHDMKAFAVVIRKQAISKKDTIDPFEVGWQWLIQRLERQAASQNENILLVHDEGEDRLVAKLARKARRAGSAGSSFGLGRVDRPFTQLIDDPVPRRSHESYFIQLADLAAYAAFRRVVPPKGTQLDVCPSNLWDTIGDGIELATSKKVGSPPGIVVWP